MTKLIIVEGLPGTGKSTTASVMAEKLKNKGRKVLCVDEGTPNHPADYDDYDFPDFATERRLILEKWREFVSNAADDTVYVFNCIFLQNPMCETMMRFDFDLEASRAYIKEIGEIIKPMEPVIVYISRKNVRATVDRVLDERGTGWLNAVIGYHTDQGYGKARGLTGYDGYIACLTEWKKREMDILESLELEKYIVSTDSMDDESREAFAEQLENILMQL